MSPASEWLSFEEYGEWFGRLSAGEPSLYHRPLWLEAVREGFGAEIRAVLTTDGGGEPMALTPFMVVKKGPFRMMGTPLSGLYTEFAGPLFAEALDQAAHAEVLASQHRLVRRGGHYIEWGAKGEGEQVPWGRELERFGYAHTTRPTLLIDLASGEDAVWASFQGRARNMARKAEKSGVSVHTVEPTAEWMEAYYAMLRATFERQGRAAPHPLSFFNRLARVVAAGNGRCVAAEVEGRLVAGAIFLRDRGRMLYLSGTANAEGMKSAASSLIQWHAMREAMADGVTQYDMGGLGVASIDKFKRSFGGREIHHHRWVYRSRLFGLVEPAALWAARKGWIRMGGG